MTQYSIRMGKVLLFCGSLLMTRDLEANHKCPGTPKAKTFLASSTTTTAYTAVSSSRITNTSGCQRSHESDGFYKPTLSFLGEEWDQITEEASQGVGEHLEILASFAGCPDEVVPAFSQHLQENYHVLFDPSDLPKEAHISQVWDQIMVMVENSSMLNQACSPELSDHSEAESLFGLR